MKESGSSEARAEAIVGDPMLLVLCAFLAVLLQFWQQGYFSCSC